MDVPLVVARTAAGVTAPAEITKLAPGTVTGTFTVRDSVLGVVPVVPVAITVNPVVGNGPQLTERTAPLNDAVQPVGTVPAVNMTVPVNPLVSATEIVEVPAVPAVVRAIVDGLADSEKSWTVTPTLVVRDSVLGAVPVVPVTVTLNGATPVEHVTDNTAALKEAVQPTGAVPEANVRVPAKPLIAVAVTVELPDTVARVVIAGADRLKSWTVTLTFVVVDNVLGAVPVVPVTSTLNGATPVAQLTDRRALLNDAVQPVGTVPAVNVTVPVNPLIGETMTVEVPATVARVVMGGADSEKSTAWNRIGLVVCGVSVPLVPVTVTV